jgi:LPXTG-motif cell wall-anchored protein
VFYKETWIMRKIFSMALALVLALGLFGAASAQSGDARIRVVHASPDAPAVDVYANGNKVLSNVTFFAASDYLSVPAGSYKLQVVVAGETDLSKAVIDATADLKAGMDYTVAAVNAVASIEPLVLMDNNAAPAAGKAHVRFVHASPDAPAVDIRVKGGPKLYSNVSFKGTGDYTPVDAGTYDLEVTAAGSDTVVKEIPGVKLEAGTVYTAWATNTLANLAPEITVDAKAAAGSTPPAAPGNLPTTGAADSLPALLLGALALAALGGGALLRRRTARS